MQLLRLPNLRLVRVEVRPIASEDRTFCPDPVLRNADCARGRLALVLIVIDSRHGLVGPASFGVPPMRARGAGEARSAIRVSGRHGTRLRLGPDGMT
jgi:hypothetical protein